MIQHLFIRPVRNTALLAAFFGLVLHAYIALNEVALDFNPCLIGFFICSCAPYVIAAAVAHKSTMPILGFGAAVGGLIFDLSIYYTVFSASKASTTAIIYLVAPPINLLVVGPASALMAWGLMKTYQAAANKLMAQI
ncbi:hypothetical protein ACUHMQ_11530 [Chitinimonas sp. PSY-7]|uniref:hypothetical protein n=1 Tax=Chitinimonas sp. PSY-7 TaxID=3459088 RepID=UPI00403FCA1E